MLLVALWVDSVLTVIVCDDFLSSICVCVCLTRCPSACYVAGSMYVSVASIVRHRKMCCAFGCHPFLKLPILKRNFCPSKNVGTIFVCFDCFSETNLFVSSPLCCFIFTFSSRGYYSLCDCFYEVISWNKNYHRSGIFSGVQPEAQEFLRLILRMAVISMCKERPELTLLCQLICILWCSAFLIIAYASPTHSLCSVWNSKPKCLDMCSPCHPIDNIITLMTDWRITGKIIKTTIMLITYAHV